MRFPSANKHGISTGKLTTGGNINEIQRNLCESSDPVLSVDGHGLHGGR
jgi:hypothetical protein